MGFPGQNLAKVMDCPVRDEVIESRVPTIPGLSHLLPLMKQVAVPRATQCGKSQPARNRDPQSNHTQGTESCQRVRLGPVPAEPAMKPQPKGPRDGDSGRFDIRAFRSASPPGGWDQQGLLLGAEFWGDSLHCNRK